MIDTESLKGKIIDLAIQGKLTKQLSTDSDVNALYNRIQKEKARLVKEGIIKKEKSLTEINESDIPFPIPDSWKWVTVSNIFNVRSAMRIHMTDWEKSGIPFLRGRDLVQLAKCGNAEPEVFISRGLYEELKDKGGVPQKGDILVSAVGTLGKAYVVTGTQEFYYKDAYVLCFENIGKVYPEYIKYVIESSFIHDIIYRDAIGMTVAQMTITKANTLPIPLPPLEEQNRIVRLVENAFAQIDIINSLQQQYESDCEVLKEKIIDAGIRGKLTEQLPEDGNAEDLYAQIQKEKAKLIKEGKIKKEKPLPEISDDEISFEIPDNWKWVRLASIISLQSGQDLSPSDYNGETKGIPYITGASNIDGIESLIINRWTEYPKAYAYKGYILLSCKGTVGKLTILKEDVVHIARQIMGIRSFCLDCKYLLYYLESMINEIKEAQKGLIPGIERKDILNLLCPLPPIKEQNRIASKIEAILELVNQV